VDVVAAVGADKEPAPLWSQAKVRSTTQLTPEAGAVLGLAAGDDRLDLELPDEAPVLVVFIAAVGDQHLRPAPQPPSPAMRSVLMGPVPREGVDLYRNG
jgi:hypothetical protein